MFWGCYSCKYVEDVFRLKLQTMSLFLEKKKPSLLHYHSEQRIFRLKMRVYYCILFQDWKSKQHDTLYQQRQRKNQLLTKTFPSTLAL